MPYQTIIYDKSNGIARIRFNRPDRLNAVISELYLEVIDALTDSEHDDNVRTIVFSGEGRAFCVGADLKVHSAGTRTEQQVLEYLKLGNEVCRRIFHHQKIIISAIHGYALGAGAEISCSSDFILMTESAQIGFPEISIGTHIGGGLTTILPRLVGLAKARELIFTGCKITGIEAKKIGLISQVFKDDKFEQSVEEFASNIATGAPISQKLAKKTINNFQQDYSSRLNSELDAIRACMLTNDWQEGIDAFNEKRKPIFQGK